MPEPPDCGVEVRAEEQPTRHHRREHRADDRVELVPNDRHPSGTGDRRHEVLSTHSETGDENRLGALGVEVRVDLFHAGGVDPEDAADSRGGDARREVLDRAQACPPTEPVADVAA
jgi:hypothetical protein